MDDIPESEQAACECVILNRTLVFRFFEEFQRSVRLFELLERGGNPTSTPVFMGEFIHYRMIAARDGALNIFHVGCSLESLRAQLPTCPTLAARVDARKLREAWKFFQREFPNYVQIRHAIAHAGQIAETPARMRENEQKAHHAGGGVTSGPGGFLAAALYEKTYSVGFAGKVFSVTLDGPTILKLNLVVSLVTQAFQSPAETP